MKPFGLASFDILETTMKTIICLFVFLFIFSTTSTPCVSAQPQFQNKVIVQGNPPLTESMIAKIIILLEWSLDIKFSEEQKIEIIQDAINNWKTNNQEAIKAVVEISNLVDDIRKVSAEDRNKAKVIIKADILKGLHTDRNDKVSQMVLQVYQNTHSANSETVSPSTSVSTTSTKSKLRVGADGFTGIYRLVRPRALDLNNSVYQHGFQVEYITFLPDGHVFWRLPSEGLLYFDAAVAQKAYPDDWGTYEIKNGEIHVWRGPGKKLYIITQSGERLNNPPSLGKGSFRPVPAADGLKLDGKYRRYENDSFITFTKDGSFRDEGAFRNFGDMARPNRTIYQDDGRGGSGTYLIEQNTLELRYSDGRFKRFPFIAFPENLAKKPSLDSFILFQIDVMTRY